VGIFKNKNYSFTMEEPEAKIGPVTSKIRELRKQWEAEIQV
jgi:hypothetical protein